MNKVDIPTFETTLQKTHIWFKDLAQAMGWTDIHLSYLAFRAVLHTLRDRLPVEVVAKLASQLPLLIRGIYYEGWVPSHTSCRIHNSKDFYILVAEKLRNPLLDPEADMIVENVFKVLASHISEGEIKHLKKVLPESIAILLPV